MRLAHLGKLWWLPSVLAVAYAVYSMHAQADPSQTRTTRVFTVRELGAYDDAARPEIYLSIMGRVFDVSSGAEYYAVGESYACFAARDASLAFVTGGFDDDRTDDVSPLTGKQLAELASWVNGTYHDARLPRRPRRRLLLRRHGPVDARGRDVARKIDEARARSSSEADAPVPLLVAAQRRRRYVACKGGRVPRRRRLAGDDDERARACAPTPRRRAPRRRAGCAPDAAKCDLPPREAPARAAAAAARAPV
ncbi:hypothetical protein JL720_15820 [Aureococcus anophagefferens]|nr:hypothetical protein JL720_15820 [Aureococcus anophagefferens]